MRKMPHIPGFRMGIFLFVPDTLECPCFNLSDDQVASLTAKISQKIKKTVFIDQYQTVAELLASPSPQLWAKFGILLHPPISIDVKLD